VRARIVAKNKEVPAKLGIPSKFKHLKGLRTISRVSVGAVPVPALKEANPSPNLPSGKLTSPLKGEEYLRNNMLNIGLDIGSRTIKLIVSKNGEIVRQDVCRNTFDSEHITMELLKDYHYDHLTVTGYGRHLFDGMENCSVISEIKAFSLGVHALNPECRTILDIGGQDTKAIALDTLGRMKKFVMNDKCAAGTGRFLEIMANALNYDLESFGKAAYDADGSEKVNNMCTVFAESEVISLLTRGAKREHVARGIHESIVERAVSQLQKVGIEGTVAFVGGVALNPAMRKILSEQLTIFTPENPQIVGALGCLRYAEKG
jgi:predicted CoA-substrate-specific enzyme activase